MSLATRCPACSTVFRVVQDQLRVSEGWVRCGHCQEVFNAVESLFELGSEVADGSSTTAGSEAGAGGSRALRVRADRDDRNEREGRADDAAKVEDGPSVDDRDRGDPPAGEAIIEDAPAGNHAAADMASTGDEEARTPAEGPSADTDGLDAAAPTSSTGAADDDASPPGNVLSVADDQRAQTSTGQALAAATTDDDDAMAGPTAAVPAPAPTPLTRHTADAGDASTSASPVPAGTDDDEDFSPSQLALGPMEGWDGTGARRKRGSSTLAPDDDTPEFVRRADRAERWRQPHVRAVLLVVIVAMTVLLLAQIGISERSQIAARWPSSTPALQALCGLAGCEVRPPAQIEALVLDSTQLRQTDAARVLRFEADLRNQARHAVLMPSIELSLTDSTGKLLVRRVLRPSEFAPGRDTLTGGQMLQVQTRLQIGDLAVSGFLAEVFYP